MKNILFILLSISIVRCSIEKSEIDRTSNFAYQLIDYEDIDYKSCLVESSSKKCDKLAWEASFIGDYYKALDLWNLDAFNKKVFTTSQDSLLDISDYNLRPAKKILLQRIKNEIVVIFNEGHHLSHHRMTTIDYLEEMYEFGFRYLGDGR